MCWEILKYDILVVLKFWWNGKDFLQERQKWKENFLINENKNIR